MASPVALSPKRLRALGSFAEVVVGVAGGSGTTTVLVFPQFKALLLLVACAAGSTATAPRADNYSNNQVTVTHASGELFTYIAHGLGWN